VDTRLDEIEPPARRLGFLGVHGPEGLGRGVQLVEGEGMLHELVQGPGADAAGDREGLCDEVDGKAGACHLEHILAADRSSSEGQSVGLDEDQF
jgi:hypothetical protein